MNNKLSKKRIDTRNSVLDILQLYYTKIRCYGSFSNNSFHISLCGNYSFSDIDLVSLSELSLLEMDDLRLNIQDKVFEKTGIHFRISIRNKIIHNSLINKNQSKLIAQAEFLSKISSANEEYKNYQVSKLILRVIGGNNYFLSPLSINGYVKNGINNGLAVELVENKLGLKKISNPIFSENYSFNSLSIHQFILDSNISNKYNLALNLYNQCIMNFDFDSDLIKDIKRKLLNAGLFEDKNIKNLNTKITMPNNVYNQLLSLCLLGKSCGFS